MKSGFANWSDMRVFLAVLRSGSTLAASKGLGLAQPTVARRIEALEHALGVTLFERDTRGFRPTAAAQGLIAPAEAMEAAAEAVAQAAENGRQARPIRITAPRANFSANFAAILSEFSARNPGVQFELVANDEIVDLVAGEADVAIRISAEIADKRLICRKMTTVYSTLFASRAYADRHGLPRSGEALAGHRFVVVARPAASMRINRWLTDRLEPSQIVTRCSNVELLITAVKAGLGIGPMPVSLARGDDTLVPCFDPPEGTSVFSWLVISPEAYRRPEVRAFSAYFAPRFVAMFRQP